MTIDEAISHEERNIEINKLIGEVSDCEPTNAIDYHRQLVEWLKELKQLREQEPKTGYWRAVYQGDEIIDYRCSECEFGNTFGKGTYGMNYCPNCGAKMEEE